MIISFVVPCYNSRAYIPRTILSILTQEPKDFEIIFIDDASTDDTIQVIETFMTKYSFKHYKLRRNSENKGPAYSRNKGIREASGEYVMFLDSDDYLHSSLLSRLQNGLLDRKPDMVCWKFKAVGKGFVPRFRFNGLQSGIYPGCHVLEKILVQKNFWISMVSAIYKREKILKENLFFNENLRFGEDVDFIWKFLATSSHVLYVDAILSYYLIRKGSITTTPNIRRLESLFAPSHIFDFVKQQNPCQERKSQILSGLLLWNIFRSLHPMEQLLGQTSQSDKFLAIRLKHAIRKVRSIAKTHIHYIIRSKSPFFRKLQILVLLMSPKLFKFFVLCKKMFFSILLNRV